MCKISDEKLKNIFIQARSGGRGYAVMNDILKKWLEANWEKENK